VSWVSQVQGLPGGYKQRPAPFPPLLGVRPVLGVQGARDRWPAETPTPLKEGLPPPLDPATAAAVAHLNSLAGARMLGAAPLRSERGAWAKVLGALRAGVRPLLRVARALVPLGVLEGGEKSRKKRSFTNGQLLLPPGCQVCQLSLNEIAEATNYFSPAQLIGSGGFGPVFRGQLHGTTVAVKKRDEESLQGDDEFFNEVSAPPPGLRSHAPALMHATAASLPEQRQRLSCSSRQGIAGRGCG